MMSLFCIIASCLSEAVQLSKLSTIYGNYHTNVKIGQDILALFVFSYRMLHNFRIENVSLSNWRYDQREGLPLLTVRTEVNGDSKSTNERGPSLVDSFGLSCWYKRFWFCLFNTIAH
jgi:hypothetical protein